MEKTPEREKGAITEERTKNWGSLVRNVIVGNCMPSTHAICV